MPGAGEFISSLPRICDRVTVASKVASMKSYKIDLGAATAQPQDADWHHGTHIQLQSLTPPLVINLQQLQGELTRLLLFQKCNLSVHMVGKDYLLRLPLFSINGEIPMNERIAQGLKIKGLKVFKSENIRKTLMVKVWALLGEGGEKTVDIYLNETRVEM